MLDHQAEQAIVKLNYRYVQCLDDGSYGDWPEMFVQDGSYKIHPRENVEAGLEGYLIYCSHRGMIRDRAVALMEANIYNVHYDRHLLSNVLVEGAVDGVYSMRANYLVVQTDIEGHSTVFSAGEYRDKVVFVDGEPKFKEKLVIADTFNVPRMLAVPL